MRIAMLAWESLHSIPVGGVAAHVTELAAALARQGQDVHVFTRRAPGQSDYDRIDGVHYYRCAYQGHHEFVDDINNMCAAFLHRLVGVEDSTGQPFDIVHAHDWLCANAMIWAKQTRHRRAILTIHATEYGRSGNIFHDGRSARVREQENAGVYWADRVISVSHATRDEVCWMYEAPLEKTAVVYNGVNRGRFDRPVQRDAVRRQYQIGPMDPVVLFCGRLDYQKGPDILLEAFPAALNYMSHAKLVFAGDGGMRGELERRARDRRIHRAVRFLGYLGGEALVDVFKIADVVCIPSRNEPFGIVVLEAWSAAKPVLVTHNGGPSEYVEHEQDGLKIFENPESVAWGIHQCFSDFDRARRMGAAGRRKVERGFTWASVAEQTLDVYDPDHAIRRAEAQAGSEAPQNIELTLDMPKPAARPNGHDRTTPAAPAGPGSAHAAEAGKPAPERPAANGHGHDADPLSRADPHGGAVDPAAPQAEPADAARGER
jgi:glycosyltransferase involved in cell wall biosynthesis